MSLSEKIIAPAANSADAIVKPKILRRPVQFSSPTANEKVVPLPPLLNTASDTKISDEKQPDEPASRPWQEDARFGVVLIVLLTLLNGVAAMILSGNETSSPTHNATQRP